MLNCPHMETTVFLRSAEQRGSGAKAAFEALSVDVLDRLQDVSSIFLLVSLCHPERQLSSTHIDAVRGVLDAIRARTKASIQIGDGSHYGTKAVWRQLGYDQLFEAYHNISFVDLNEDAWTEQTITLSSGETMVVRRAESPQKAGMRLALVPMKTHRTFGVALSVLSWTLGTWVVPPRASARGMVFAREPFLAVRQPEESAEIIAQLYKALPCDAAIIDGVTAMEGAGPVEGTLVPMQTVLSGTDLFAVDAVASTLMGIDPGSVEHLRVGAGQNLGTIDLGRIEVPPALLSEKTRIFAR